MKCRYLMGRNVKQCRVVVGNMVLSADELHDYCESGNFEQCPVFIAVSQRRENTITLHDYCRIYSEWARMARVDTVGRSV